MKMFAVFILMALASGCATQRTLIGPDGTPHASVTCGNIDRCYEYARDACGGNYKIVNTTNDVNGDAVSGQSTSHNMLVKCEAVVPVK